MPVWTFPFPFLLLFYNLKSIPKSPKASGQPSNLRKKQSTFLACPSPFRRWVAGRKGGHKQPAASRNLTTNSGPQNTLRLTSDKSLPLSAISRETEKSPTLSFTTVSRIYVTSYTDSLKSDRLMSPTELSLPPQTSNFIPQIYLEGLSNSCRYHHKKIFFHHVHIKANFSIYIVEGNKS